MLFRVVFFVSLIFVTNSKSILLSNITTTIENTSTFSTDPTTIETITESDSATTTIQYEEETSTSNLLKNSIEFNKSFEFQSNYSRNNDSVFISFHSNASDSFVSINNTFSYNTYDNNPCEILFKEYSNGLNEVIKTQIIIDLNRPLTRDIAIQLGDRLMDMADLLQTLQSMDYQNRMENEF